MILYKYVAEERIDILENSKIRFSQPGVLNDPFEVKPRFHQLSDDNEIIDSFYEGIPNALIDEYKKLPVGIRKQVSIKNFMELAKKEMPEYFKQYKELLNEITPVVRDELLKTLDKRIGILSLTKNFKNKLMWAHYADGYKGFIIGFDSTNLFFNKKRTDNDEFGYLRKVKYVEHPSFKPMIEQEGADILLVKGIEWEYEEEWRIIRPVHEADEIISADCYPICLFKFAPNIIREIIMGPNISEENKEKLLSIALKYKEASLFQAKINTQNCNIEVYPIK